VPFPVLDTFDVQVTLVHAHLDRGGEEREITHTG
jgi:hypothetical protein